MKCQEKLQYVVERALLRTIGVKIQQRISLPKNIPNSAAGLEELLDDLQGKLVPGPLPLDNTCQYNGRKVIRTCTNAYETNIVKDPNASVCFAESSADANDVLADFGP